MNDCKHALKLKPDYPKALNRAANCCLLVKDYDQCILYCDQFLEKNSTDNAILDLRNKAVAGKVKQYSAFSLDLGEKICFQFIFLLTIEKNIYRKHWKEIYGRKKLWQRKLIAKRRIC